MTESSHLGTTAALTYIFRHSREAPNTSRVFQGPWQNVIASCEALAESHATLSRRIGTDVEKPLHEYQAKSREMSAVVTVQGNLTALAKELGVGQRRAQLGGVGRPAALLAG